MKTIIFAAAVLAASITASHAGDVPTDMIGDWCDPGVYNGRSQYFAALGEPCKNPNVLTIDDDGYSIFEMSCRFTSVTAAIDYKQARSAKTMGAPTMKITSACERENCRWVEWGTFTLSQGVLSVNRHSRKTSCPSG
jgi:hypothetical protein